MYMCVRLSLYTYIYIEREREMDRWMETIAGSRGTPGTCPKAVFPPPSLDQSKASPPIAVHTGLAAPGTRGGTQQGGRGGPAQGRCSSRETQARSSSRSPREAPGERKGGRGAVERGARRKTAIAGRSSHFLRNATGVD